MTLRSDLMKWRIKRRFDRWTPLVEQWHEGKLHFMVRRSSSIDNYYLVLGKESPFTEKGSLYEPGPVWIEYSNNVEQAVRALRYQMTHIPQGTSDCCYYCGTSERRTTPCPDCREADR
jgi:hypothetical protein